MTFEDSGDGISATLELLRNDQRVGELCQGRVFGAEIPRDEAEKMPRTAIVVSHAGGGGIGTGSRDFIKHQILPIDIMCYGATFRQASTLRAAAYRAMKQFRTRKLAGIKVHWYTQKASPIQFRDPDTDWPAVVEQMQVFHADANV